MIAEGFLRFTPDEFVRYLRMARGELGELQTHLTVATHRGLLSVGTSATNCAPREQSHGYRTRLLVSKLPLLKPKKHTRFVR